MSPQRLFLSCSAALLVLFAGQPAAAEQRSPKVDRALRESLSTGARTQQVIITVTPGHRTDIRQALEAHGDVIRSEHPSIDALAAEIHSLDVDEIARHPWVLSVSADAVVFAGAASSDNGKSNNGNDNGNTWNGNNRNGNNLTTDGFASVATQ